MPILIMGTTPAISDTVSAITIMASTVIMAGTITAITDAIGVAPLKRAPHERM